MLCALTALALAALTGAAGAAALSASEQANEILRVSGVRAGLCVHIGVSDGKLTAALGRAGNFLVHGIALDADSLAAARKHLQALKLYGKASVEHLAIQPLPYHEDTVNLLVVSDLPAALKAGLTVEEVLRVLTPNGVALSGGAQFRKGRAVRKEGCWPMARKPQPQELSDWTHYEGGPDGSRVSKDLRVGPPRRLKWIGRPTMYLAHFSRPGGWVSGGGRVYYVYDERHPRMAGPARLNLVARDAYNGMLLWRKPVPIPGKLRRGRPVFLAHGMVAAGDRLIAPMGENRSLVALDATTGKVVLDYKTGAARVLLCGDALILQGHTLRVLHPKTGKLRWKQDTPYCKKILAGRARVYARFRRRDKKTRQYEWGVAAFDIKDGKELWWAPAGEDPIGYDDARIILLARAAYHFQGKRKLAALSADTGRRLWTQMIATRYVYGIDGTVWHIATWKEGERSEFGWIGLDAATGKERRRLASYVKEAITHHWTRCSGTNATVRYLITGNTMDFLDVRTGQHLRSSAARSSCQFGVRVANGMVYTFPVDCGCFKSLRGVLGMAPQETPMPAPNVPPLVKGPAYGAVPNPKSPIPNPQSTWPCYRHDAARSGSSATQVPEDFKSLWQVDVGGSPTAPTAGHGLVFVASQDTHQLAALDAKTGERRWKFIPGGPVDTPPTLDNGAAVFGCRNGWVYCLRAADGKLAWRYRVAPDERRIIAFGRLESPVPVYGSVVVANNVAYCSAGRTSELDGGIRVCALDVASGDALWHENIPRAELKKGARLDKRRLSEQGALGDILRSDGRYVYMRGWRFDLKTGAKKFYYNWKGGLRPSNKTGFLDASMKRPWSHRGVAGQMLVASQATTCGFMSLQKEGWQLAYFTAPGKGEYRIFARHFDAKGQPNKEKPGWTIEKCPIAAEAMAIAGSTLFVAGPPDELEPEGGLLWALSVADGRKLAEVELDAPPVFDGLAAAGGRLYVSCKDGSLRCFGKK